MKISYVYHLDASREAVQSGRPHSILRGLEAAGAEVQQVFPLVHRYGAQRMLKKVFWHSIGRHYRVDRDAALLMDFARQAERRLAEEAGDVIFSPSTLPISWLETDLPIAFCADAPLAAMLNYYDSFSRLAPPQLRFAEEAEAAALGRAHLAVYPSEWAAQSAIRSYGIDPARVAVIPFGANFGKGNTRAAVAGWIKRRRLEEIRLLFVGLEWERKGGPLVLATARKLIAQGRRVRVDIVGATPRIAPAESFVRCHRLLRYSVPSELRPLEALFQQAHFFFMPSRAEAYGMVYCEANAFGLPCLATATGGVGQIIRNGINGRTLPLDADADAYAEAILAATDTEAHYQALASSSYEEFAGRLNWTTFCRRLLKTLHDRLPHRDPSIAATRSSALS